VVRKKINIVRQFTLPDFRLLLHVESVEGRNPLNPRFCLESDGQITHDSPTECKGHSSKQYIHPIRSNGPHCRTVSAARRPTARRAAGCGSWSAQASRGGDVARICSKDFYTGHFEVGGIVVGRGKDVGGVAGVRSDQRRACSFQNAGDTCPVPTTAGRRGDVKEKEGRESGGVEGRYHRQKMKVREGATRERRN
jgi:hypothetical protein